jgi:polar amino acid transport system substrate-binding protein
MLKPEWADYEMPLESILPQPWGLAVKQGEKAFADFMSSTVKDWHKSGLIAQLEKKYNIKPTKFAQEMHDKFK